MDSNVNVTFEAEDGMTWKEFINSGYNSRRAITFNGYQGYGSFIGDTDDFVRIVFSFPDGTSITNNSTVIYTGEKASTGIAVSINDLIINEEEYLFYN